MLRDMQTISYHPLNILQAPTTQLATMSIDPKFVELAADVLEIYFFKYRTRYHITSIYSLAKHSLCL